ncbi:NAD(P)/FAD-dependent oxidoreductase [Aureimonas sp. AU4]|uniref:NAD(P)/FAD-dependent oxidoreductase n=1 Tax=Aureimonas sp. AU4 TaxID=1638163 RepID=UPI001FCCC9F5|nr:NAD(P)/FAD-dependent oxidoreductase [Aureimonas sp. AU4]
MMRPQRPDSVHLGEQQVMPAADPPPSGSATSGPRIVVLGAGFGGLEVARALGAAGVPATVVDQRNHHLFQPLLYQVATAALSATDVAEPIRRILAKYPSVRVVFGEVKRVEHDRKRLLLTCGKEIAYDILVLATGATHGYFGHDEWARFAPGLKSIEDARTIRSRLLLAFERAERESYPDEQRRLTTIAVVGGGPTGVEMAGAIAELSRFALARDFRNIDPITTRVLLIEAGPRLLGTFSQEASDYARARLERLGVAVRLGTVVSDIAESSIEVAGVREPVGLVIWAAGVRVSPLAAQLGVPTDRAGRIPVAPDLSVPGLEGVYALGDIASSPGEDGRPLPGLAQVAKQQGVHLGRELARRNEAVGDTALQPFRYESRGNAAIVGRHAAVFEHGRHRLSGFVAWIAWAIVHVYLLVGFQHRLTVSVQWLWRYLTYERGARLIAEDVVEAPLPAQPRLVNAANPASSRSEAEPQSTAP